MSFHKSFPDAGSTPSWKRHTWGGSSQDVGAVGFDTQYVVETPTGVLYKCFLSDQSVVYVKSTDGGLTWSLPRGVSSQVVNVSFSLWYDRWSNIAAGLIHFAYTASNSDDTYYRSLDAENSDTLSTETVIFAGASTANGSNLSIVRARGGNLLCHTVIDAGAEGGFYKSTDVGATWGAVTVNEAIATADQIILLPGWAADNQDVMAFFWDASANEISRQLYDDSADTWSETAIVTATESTTGFPHFAATVDIANSQNILIAWTGIDTINADLMCWTVTEGAVTAKTDVVTNSTNDQGLAALGISTANGDWWAVYSGKSDGAETWNTSVNLYYKISTDDGATWGSETALTAELYTRHHLCMTPRFASKPTISNSVASVAAAAYTRQLLVYV